ncbi:Beta-phosphoglucomutase [Acidisarcina polymorpha]|uniref:Beta-phosphoglucomutase n=1 Tax=Acidisarcina polymorpha TaxID=2211140 RepID=A0A2Z5G8G9_9BACT|nr:HAD family phosphatase [Acidisarcina polymorpha]AXC15269.1 Beta-phosphoglucomutase [Acidisarcina polymorpha]
MTLKLPEGPFKAYLFDCDGTIVDSMPLHYLAWKRIFAEHGCEFSERTHYSLGGMPTEEIVAMLNTQQGLDMSPSAVALQKEDYYYEIIHQLEAVPEVIEHIDASYGKIPFAVVSGGTRDSVTRSLNTLGILDRFETLVCAEDYQNSKPHPEPYLTAAKRLGIAPEDCLVFEDTEIGIQAATAAGMASVKIPQPWERAKAVSVTAAGA